MNSTDKSFKVTCENCEHTFVVDDESAWGQDTFCPNCGNITHIPVPEISEPEHPIHSKQEGNSKTETKECPYCRETIIKAAIKCKHCGEFLKEGMENNPNLVKHAHNLQEFGKKGEKLGCALTLLFTLPIVGLFVLGPVGLIAGLILGLIGLGLMTIAD